MTALLPLTLIGCLSNKVDRLTVDDVVGQGLRVADVDKACQLGASFAHVLPAPVRRTPHKAMVITELTSALCEEAKAWEAELTAERALKWGEGAARTAAVKDARLLEQRHHALAAQRFWRAYEQLGEVYGPIGEGCPKIGERDELMYLLGLYSGVNALLHDKAAYGANAVPADVVMQVARGAQCVSDERWWNVPSALAAACYATIPGSAPEGVDPWADLTEHAALGEAKGVRLGRALEVLIADNAGREDQAIAAIRAHAASLEAHAQDPDHLLLDAYAHQVSLHVADLLWTSAEGHRAPELGVPRAPEVLETPGEDPFAEDPFGAEEDPFAEPEPEAAPESAPEETP